MEIDDKNKELGGVQFSRCTNWNRKDLAIIGFQDLSL
jgi:hypothetical protein